MAKLTIIGNDKPVIGTEEMYSVSSINDWLHPNNNNPFKPPMKPPVTKWGIMVLTKNGWVRTPKNDKEKLIAPYKFSQKSLLHKSVKIVVERGSDIGELIVQPQRAKEPKITKVELLDTNYKPIPKGKKLSYKDTIIARAHCVEMFKMNVSFTLWEDDAKGEGHDPIVNAFNKINVIPIIKQVNQKGIAEAIFRLPAYTMAVQIANARIAAGDKNEGKTHEYYVTADVVDKKLQKASPNVNVDNPTYNPKPPKRERPKTQTPPPAKPKQTIPPVNKPKPKPDSAKFPVTSTAKSSSDSQGKILSAEFVDNNGNRLHSSKVGQTVRIKIVANKKKDEKIKVKVKIWEEDNFTWTNDEIYNKDHLLIWNNNYINNVQLTKKLFDKANDGGRDGTKQDYFIEVIHNDTSVKSSLMPITLDAEPTKTSKNVSTAVVQKAPKQKFEKITGLGKEAVLYITSEIATEIKIDKNGKLISYPDYGGYNGMDEYKEGSRIYSKKLQSGQSAFPLYKMYIYRGNKTGEAVQKLKQDIDNKTHENAESTVLTVARHAQTNNKNYGSKGPIPPNTLTSLYRIRYMQAWNHAGKESFRYRFVDNNTSNLKPLKDFTKEVSSGAMSLGSRSSISIDPWKSKDLIGCVGIRNSDGGNHSSYSSEIVDTSSSNYKFIYHAMNNYLETIIPELTGVYGRRGYSSNGKVPVKASEFKEEIKVFVLVDSLPEINSCDCNLEEKRKKYYGSFGEKTVKYIEDHTQANKFKGLYMVAQRRQENGFNINTPLNNPMNIKGSGDAGKEKLSTHETYGGKYQAVVDSFAKFTSEDAGFQGYLDLLKKNYPYAYSALTTDSMTIEDFVVGLEDKGIKGAYATGEAKNGVSGTEQYKKAVKDNFKSVQKDYKKWLECKLCSAKTPEEKNKINEDLKLLSKLK